MLFSIYYKTCHEYSVNKGNFPAPIAEVMEDLVAMFLWDCQSPAAIRDVILSEREIRQITAQLFMGYVQDNTNTFSNKIILCILKKYF